MLETQVRPAQWETWMWKLAWGGELSIGGGQQILWELSRGAPSSFRVVSTATWQRGGETELSLKAWLEVRAEGDHVGVEPALTN